MFLFSKFKRGKKNKIPAFGGDYLSPIIAPSERVRRLEILAFSRYFVLALLAVIIIFNLGLTILLLNKIDMEIYVADGSRFGCKVKSYQNIEVGGK